MSLLERLMALIMMIVCASTTGCEGDATTEQAALENADQEVTPMDGNADVEFVEVRQADDGTWTFHVTVRHPDTGWEDYADGWDVVLPDGTVLKPNPEDAFTRVLLHPHVNEQPFTRSQSGLNIPQEVQTVTVRAHDLVDGFGGKEVTVQLSAEQGENFKVIR